MRLIVEGAWNSGKTWCRDGSYINHINHVSPQVDYRPDCTLIARNTDIATIYRAPKPEDSRIIRGDLFCKSCNRYSIAGNREYSVGVYSRRSYLNLSEWTVA